MEFNQVLDWRAGPGVCRCCLSEGCYKDISTEYFWMGEKEIYAEMLLECYSLTISYQEGRPNSNSRLICEVCITRLRDAANFKKQVINSERNFAKHLIEVPVEREVEVTYTPTESLPIQQVKDESRVSDDGDFDDSQFDANFDCDDDADDQPLKNFATNVLKREDTVPDVTVEKVKTKDGKSPSKRKAAAKKGGVSPAKKAKAMKQEKEAKPSSSKPPKTERKKGEPTLETALSERKALKPSRQVIGYSEEYMKLMADIDRSIAIRKSILTILEHSAVCPFKWLKNRYCCFYCEWSYTDPAALRTHHSTEHGRPATYQVLAAVKKLKKNELAKVDITDVSCKLCDQPIKDLNSLKSHLTNIHKKMIDTKYSDGVLPFKLQKDVLQCQFCDENFCEFKTLNQHMNLHFQNFICETCGAGFITPDRLRTHMLSHETSSVPCNACSKIFRSLFAKNEHYANVHMQVCRHRCPHCREAFRNYFQRNKHITAVHGLKCKEFKCSLCPKVFTLSGKLTHHVKTVHLKQKRHTCHICEWKVFSKSELKEHMIRHGGERKFQCHVCKKSYARKYTLREHMRIHDNDRRFVCAVCGKAFVQNCSLKHHMKVHHPDVISSLEELNRPAVVFHNAVS